MCEHCPKTASESHSENTSDSYPSAPTAFFPLKLRGQFMDVAFLHHPSPETRSACYPAYSACIVPRVICKGLKDVDVRLYSSPDGSAHGFYVLTPRNFVIASRCCLSAHSWRSYSHSCSPAMSNVLQVQTPSPGVVTTVGLATRRK
jgi:hypothetical protein